MPVRKSRNLQDPSLPQAIARVWDFADRISERRCPSGVHKHRSIEKAQELRDRWEEANFQRYWASKEAIKKTVG